MSDQDILMERRISKIEGSLAVLVGLNVMNFVAVVSLILTVLNIG